MESTPPPPAASFLGRVIAERYRIKSLLGEGGMGAVYLAEHTLMRKQVALKLLHADMSEDNEVLARFKREAEAAARVEHPNVAAATDFGQTEEGAFFLVLEYVEGTSLRAAIDQGAFGFSRALHVARQIALALERAHSSGIVHRDLKPENVMLVQKGDDPDFVKVLDFGIAKLEPHPQRDATQPLTRMGTILGTPEYMAPEQALGEVVGPGANLYAVGVMLYEMLTSKHPFDASDRMAILSMHIVAPVPPMSERNPALDVPASIEAVARRLLEKDPKDRLPSARALVDAIDVAAADAGVALPHAVSSRHLPRESDPGPPSSSWTPHDALAKTDYGILPAAPPPSAKGDGPPPLPGPLARLPRNVALAIVIGGPIFLLLIVFVTILAARARSPVAVGDAAVVAADGAVVRNRASAEELRVASGRGLPGISALATEFPDDPAVERALVLALSDAGKTSEALRHVKNIDPIDDALLLIVQNAAQRAETADEAFVLLEGPLGARGVDGLIELTNKTVPIAARTRATKALARPEIKANASPAASVLLEMQSAKGCEKKKDLLDRAKESGDARILPQLKAFKSPRGCGFMGMRDCWACMRKGDDLDDTIHAVEARSAK